MNRVLITGANGQVATIFARKRPVDVVLSAVTHQQCDISARDQVDKTIAKFGPDVVVNLAAYNAVDQAESARESAFAVNAVGAGNVARAAESNGARMIHLSTDYVFDGSQKTPYSRGARPRPINVYGESKLEGEKLVLDNSPRGLVVRTAWVFSAEGKNFVARILERMKSRQPLRMVSDQCGGPTSGEDLADVLWQCVRRPDLPGIFHFTNGGSTTPLGFAEAIGSLALQNGLISGSPEVSSVSAAEFGAPARRPAYSVLDSSDLLKKLAIEQRDWRDALDDVIHDLQGTRQH